LAERNYIDPTPVQTAVLEPNAAGRDLLVSAQTGSGKTVAYGLAIAPSLLGDAETLPAPAGRESIKHEASSRGVILSGVRTSLREVRAESKAPMVNVHWRSRDPSTACMLREAKHTLRSG